MASWAVHYLLHHPCADIGYVDALMLVFDDQHAVLLPQACVLNQVIHVPRRRFQHDVGTLPSVPDV
jgi:hypothetical protein